MSSRLARAQPWGPPKVCHRSPPPVFSQIGIYIYSATRCTCPLRTAYNYALYMYVRLLSTITHLQAGRMGAFRGEKCLSWEGRGRTSVRSTHRVTYCMSAG